MSAFAPKKGLPNPRREGDFKSHLWGIALLVPASPSLWRGNGVNTLRFLFSRSEIHIPYFLNKHPWTCLKFWLKGWALNGRRALNQGGHLLSSPVGNQQYLSSIIPFTHRVISNVAIEMDFPCTCIPTIKESDGEGRRRLIQGVFVCYFGLGSGC